MIEPDVIERTLGVALRNGGDFAEVFAEDRRSQSASLDDGKVEDLTTGMLLRVEPGDQIVADGVLERVVALRVDESILTGESEPGERTAGEVVRSGAFVVEGSATFAVTAVGVESYAERLASVARTFRHPRSPLERALNRLLLLLVAVMVPLGTRNVLVQVWQVRLGRVRLFLLDTDYASITTLPAGVSTRYEA